MQPCIHLQLSSRNYMYCILTLVQLGRRGGATSRSSPLPIRKPLVIIEKKMMEMQSKWPPVVSMQRGCSSHITNSRDWKIAAISVLQLSQQPIRFETCICQAGTMLSMQCISFLEVSFKSWKKRLKYCQYRYPDLICTHWLPVIPGTAGLGRELARSAASLKLNVVTEKEKQNE